MSAATQTLYLVGILSAFGAALYTFYNFLVAKPEQAEQERLKKLEEKRNRKSKKV